MLGVANTSAADNSLSKTKDNNRGKRDDGGSDESMNFHLSVQKAKESPKPGLIEETSLNLDANCIISSHQKNHRDAHHVAQKKHSNCSKQVAPMASQPCYKIYQGVSSVKLHFSFGNS
jgi:hypothetical protein